MNTQSSPTMERPSHTGRVEEGHAAEVAQGRRFEFGRNWSRFLGSLNDDRIAKAEESLRARLEVPDLRGKRFLDVGSGSGMFSLAARRLGATVHSFDYDPDSVGCAQELKRRFFPDDPSGAWRKAPPWTGSIWPGWGSLTSFIRGASSTTRARCGPPWKTSRRWWSPAAPVPRHLQRPGRPQPALAGDQKGLQPPAPWPEVPGAVARVPLPVGAAVPPRLAAGQADEQVAPLRRGAGGCRPGGTSWTGWAATRSRSPSRKRSSFLSSERV